MLIQSKDLVLLFQLSKKLLIITLESTVGTVTEIYDYFRLLFARIGKPYCPNHKIPITTQTNNDILKSIYEFPDQTRLYILSPIVDGEKGTHANLFEKLKKDGFLRVQVDGQIYSLRWWN